jgi:hypothetical protein
LHNFIPRFDFSLLSHKKLAAMKKRKWLTITGILIGALVLFVVGVILYLRYALPDIPLKEIKVEVTPERVEKGKYLANHVMVCMDCHSKRNWQLYSGPPEEGTLGKGGEVFDQKMGFPGSFSSANITPFKLKDWSDAEIYRAITSGVKRDGQAMFPIMPYPYYGTLDTEDVYSIIAYLRSIPSIESDPPPSVAAFPMSIILNTIPGPAVPGQKPPASDTVKYGEYLVKAAGCVECHTPAKHGQIIKELAFTGGREFQFPDGMLISSNLTPDPETGLGKWSREAFINRFHAYDPMVYPPMSIQQGIIQTVMPWTMYAGMTESDLASIYAFLQTLPPVKNRVEKFKRTK